MNDKKRMNDKELIEKWSKVSDPREALSELLKYEDFLGYDPYYSKLREALLAMAERAARS